MPTSKPVMPLILASASPRRRELMARFWPQTRLQVIVPAFDEQAAAAGWTGSVPDLALHLTAGKLAALTGQNRLPARYCALAADTVVVIDEHILGKPADADEAARHLRLLSGRTHQVLTGLSLVCRTPDQIIRRQAVETTEVRFAPLDEERIRWYIRTGEPLDKAGSYGIQGTGAAWVERIDGCYYNVMGLPVFRLLALLESIAADLNSPELSSQLLPWK